MLDATQDVVEMQGTIRITGKVVARDMTYEQFLATDFENPHVEWVNGVVLEMSPVGKQHNALTRFLIQLFENFLALAGIKGEVFHDPMVMKLNPNLPGRAPDIQVILYENLHIVKENEIAGAADLVVEVVSPGSQRQDRIEKYREYEKGGVKEYWILDPTRRESLFYQLNQQGVYDLIDTSEARIYQSKVLAKLKLNVDIFWQEDLPRGQKSSSWSRQCSQQRDNGVMKLLFLGDSLTWGGYGGSFVAEVAKRLSNHTIVNAGQGGNTVVNLLNRLDSVLEQELDGIFVMVGGNDAISYSQPETRKYYRRVQDIPDGIVTPDMFAQNYRDLLTRLQLAHVQTWVGLPPIEYNPEVVAAVRQYNELAREAANSLNIPVLDLMSQFTPEIMPQRPPLNQQFINQIGQREKSGWSDFEAEQQRGGFTFTFDGLHLTPEAARRMGQLVVEFLAQHIPELT